MERLQKFLARAGISSRRAAEKMITEGKIKVNNKVVTEMGTKVDATKDLVVVDGRPVAVANVRRWMIFYKPPSVVTTLSDPQGRRTVGDYTEKLGGRLFPVGRLDFDAEGALLLTDDGDLANKLMHPKHQVQRIYLAKVKGVPQAGSLAKLREGVRLEDGPAKAHEVSIYEAAEVNTWIKIVVTEGRQHLVKRLCAAIGHPVLRLFRPSHAGIGLQGMRPGDLRPLLSQEMEVIRAVADGKPAPEAMLKLPARKHGHGPERAEEDRAAWADKRAGLAPKTGKKTAAPRSGPRTVPSSVSPKPGPRNAQSPNATGVASVAPGPRLKKFGYSAFRPGASIDQNRAVVKPAVIAVRPPKKFEKPAVKPTGSRSKNLMSPKSR
jgi:23S rRNA pseudouridine2605 synthase